MTKDMGELLTALAAANKSDTQTQTAEIRSTLARLGNELAAVAGSGR